MKTHTSEAGKQAAKANQTASKGRTARNLHRVYEQTLRDWQAIFANDPVGKYVVIFFIAFVVEVFVSYAMNLDVVRSWEIFVEDGFAEKLAAILISLLLNGLAAIASQLLAKQHTHAVVDFEVYNIVNHMNRSEAYPEGVAREKVTEDATQDRTKFWFVVICLLLLVSGLTWQRIHLENAAGEGQPINYVWAVIPFVVLIAEVWTGIYIYYVYRRFMLQIANRREEGIAEKSAIETGRLDRLIVEIVQFCDKKEVVRVADIMTCLFRARHRSQDDDTYVDEISKKPFALRLTLVAPNGQRVSTLPVVGLLYEGAVTTGVQYTDANGNLFLTWLDYEDQLDTLIIDGASYSGPFRANCPYLIEVRAVGRGYQNQLLLA